MVNDCTDHNEQMYSLLVARASPTATTTTMERFSSCARDYAGAMSDPFDCEEGACLPLASIVETQKSRVFMRTSFSTGTLGFGFILLNPDLFGTSSASAWASTSAYASSVFSNVATATVLAASSNAPYTTANVERRLVSIGIRVCNRTQVLYREGLVAGICTPAHESLDNVDLGAVSAYDQCFRQTVDSGKTTYSVKWNGPKFSYEQEFTTGATSMEPCMGICAVSSGSNAQVYDVLIVGHYEYSGSLPRTKSMTWPDPQGAAIVMGAQSRAAMLSTSASHDSPDWWRSFRSTLVEGARLALPYVVPAAKAAAAYYTGGATAAALALASDNRVGRSRQGPKNDLKAVNKSSLLKDKKKKKK